jgi:hypothetical protein
MALLLHSGYRHPREAAAPSLPGAAPHACAEPTPFRTSRYRGGWTLTDDILRRVESFLDAHHYFLQGYVRGGLAVWETVRHQGVEPPGGQRELTEAEIERLALAQAAQVFPEWLEQEAQAGLARLKAVPVALDRFCARIGLARADILTWFPPLQAQLDALAGMLASDVPADEATAADIERLLVENWPGLAVAPPA